MDSQESQKKEKDTPSPYMRWILIVASLILIIVLLFGGTGWYKLFAIVPVLLLLVLASRSQSAEDTPSENEEKSEDTERGAKGETEDPDTANKKKEKEKKKAVASRSTQSDLLTTNWSERDREKIPPATEAKLSPLELVIKVTPPAIVFTITFVVSIMWYLPWWLTIFGLLTSAWAIAYVWWPWVNNPLSADPETGILRRPDNRCIPLLRFGSSPDQFSLDEVDIATPSQNPLEALFKCTKLILSRGNGENGSSKVFRYVRVSQATEIQAIKSYFSSLKSQTTEKIDRGNQATLLVAKQVELMRRDLHELSLIGHEVSALGRAVDDSNHALQGMATELQGVNARLDDCTSKFDEAIGLLGQLVELMTPSENENPSGDSPSDQ